LWSGTPSNIVRALRETGAEVVTIDVRSRYDRMIIEADALPRVVSGLRRRGLRPGLDRERRVAQQSMLLSRARSRRGQQLLDRSGPIDGVVQMGTGYTIGHPNVVSYEDMTVAQARAWPETFWGDVPAKMVEARLQQQAAAYQRNRGAAFSTSWAANSAVAQLGCPADKAHAVGIGLNFEVKVAEERDWSIPRFLFAGREWSRKNGPEVVAAFAEVRRSFPLAELHLAGHHPVIEQPGVIDHGHLDLADPQDRDKMRALWAAATCCVVPSRFEPAGIIYVEAMHAGIPSIGTTQGGAADLIGDAGVAIDPGDRAALIAAMREYCDPSVASAVGARARRRGVQFTWANVASCLLHSLGFGGGTEPTTDKEYAL